MLYPARTLCAMVMVNGDGTYAPSPAISQLVNFDPSAFPDARDYLDAAWEVLADGGTIRMPLGEYAHSPHYGWVEDCFGVGWQLMLTGPGRDLPFTPGSSFVVRCPDQATIDQVWDALSADPGAEACGWLKDRFGISWQVLPENMGELMARPGAHEHMMTMRKIIIDEL